ncbi:MAG: amino acid ABC transporter ATP-binding/permease protein [Halothiobacillaceae bacterium]
MRAELWMLLGGRAVAGRQVLLLAVALAALSAQVGLLAVAGWFIVASGLAGAGLYLLRDMHSPSGLIRTLALSRVVLRYGESVLGHDLLFRQMAQLRGQLFDALAIRSSRIIHGMQIDQALERIVGDVHWLEQVMPRMLWPLMGPLLLPPVIALFLAPFCSPLALLVLVPWLAWLVSLSGAARLGRRSGETLQRLAARRRVWLGESVGAMSLLRQHGLADLRQRRLERFDRLESRLLAAREWAETCLEITVVLAGALTIIVLVLAGGCLAGATPGPMLAWSVLGLLALVEALRVQPAAWLDFHRLRSRVCGLHAELSSLSQPSGQRVGVVDPEPEPAPGVARAEGDEDLHVRRLELTEPLGGRILLDAVSFSVARGEPLLVCGVSGQGKSRLLATLAGFVRPHGGEIRLGSMKCVQDHERSWHRQVAYLPQENPVLDDTVAANLRLAVPGARDDELEAVLARVGLESLLACRADGLNTAVGPEGGALSGGESRRLGLARLLLRDPACVLLDEPFTGLDARTRDRLLDRLLPWLAGRVAVIALHEPEPRLAAMGRVLWLKDGRLVPQDAPCKDIRRPASGAD